jgi:hypothetical protein
VLKKRRKRNFVAGEVFISGVQFVCDILNKVAETMATAAVASVKNEGFAPGKMIMGVLSNRVSKSQVSPGDHIYSWRSAYMYAHHGSFFCLSCFSDIVERI